MKLFIFCIILALVVGIAISCHGNGTNTNETAKVSLTSTNGVAQSTNPVFDAYVNGIRVGFALARRNQDLDENSAVQLALRLSQKH